MTVQSGAQSLLVEVVRNQTDATTEDEQSVQNTHPHVVLDFLTRESAAVAHQVHEADGNAAVNVQDQVVLLRGGDRLDGNRVVEQLGAREVLLGILLDQLDTEIRVVARLDSVTDARNY